MKLFTRIDDRLIHAQVVVGWVDFLRCQQLWVVDDHLAGDPEQQELMSLAVPEHIEVTFTATAQFVELWRNGPAPADARAMVLFQDPVALKQAVDGGFSPDMVNVGGIHQRAGREMVADGIYLSPDEEAALKDMMAGGVPFLYQPLPSNRAADLAEML